MKLVVLVACSALSWGCASSNVAIAPRALDAGEITRDAAPMHDAEAPPSAAPAIDAGPSPETRDLVALMVTPLIDAERGPTAAVVVVVTPSGSEIHAFGTIDRESAVAPDADTIFEIGSVTKVFTGLLLAIAVEQGRVTLDDPLSRHLPAVQLVSGGVEVTLRHLATHTSGLPPMPSNAIGAPPNPAAGYTPMLLLQALTSVELQSTPGTAYAYSNLGLGLLGFLLTRVYEETYEGLVRDEIAAPLGLMATAIDPPASLVRVQGYADGVEVPPSRIDTLEGGGALRSNGRDFERFLRVLLRREPAPWSSALTLMEAAHAAAPHGEMGLGIDRVAIEGALELHKSGVVPGGTTFMAYRPASGTAVTVFVNAGRIRDVEAAAEGILDGLDREPL